MRKTFFWPLFVLLCTIMGHVAAQEQGFHERFETAWGLIDDRYWNLDVLDADWNEVHTRYGELVAGLEDEAGYWSLMEAMYQEIADDHSVFVPPSRVEE